MPKWTEYTTKETLADNDEVMLYDATGKANKRGLMSKFWDYVVDKMSTAVISKLETNNKTIIGAINALNSDTVIASNRLLLTPTDYISDISATDYTVCYKIGKIVLLSINIRALSDLTAFNSYLTLPSKYSPRNVVFSSDISGTGLRIGTDGTVMPCKSVSKGKNIQTVVAYICF